jgi:beta-xylosidase
LLVAALVVSLATLAGALERTDAAPFSNPVIPGNVADPSVVRADGAYWAAATSGHWAPVFPIYRSTDLISWQQVGAVFARPPAWARGNFWAPGLAVQNGRWSVYYSASRKDGKPCIALAEAHAPTGPWHDRGFVVCQPTGSIDPSAVTDASGQRYLVWKQMGVGSGIYGALLSPLGRKLKSAPVELTAPDAPWEEGVTEGPDIVRNGDAYFLVYSGGHCCRPPCTYAVGVARADQVLGPYTKDPDNPVFHGGNGWKCPGHGTLVDGPGGELSFLHHAYADDDPFDVHRQALLDPVGFGGDGWPVFGDGGAPVGAGPDSGHQTLLDNFAGRDLAPGWQWPYNGPPAVRVGGGLLRLLAGRLSRAWVPRDYAAEAEIVDRGRLSVLMSGGREIGVSAVDGSVAVVSGRRVVTRVKMHAEGLALHVRAGRAIAAYARPRGRGWQRLGQPVMPPPGVAADRVALGPGVYGDVMLRPLRRG